MGPSNESRRKGTVRAGHDQGLCETGTDHSRLSSNGNSCQAVEMSSLSDACPVGPRDVECSDRRGAGWSRRRTLTYARSSDAVSARPQVMTVALTQWEEPGVCTRDRGRAS